MTGDPTSEIANLNYWAHWIGELGDDHADDTFMLAHDTRSWTGTHLLQHLINRLDPTAAHLPLNLHTLHTLIATRPGLLHHRPAMQTSLSVVLDRLGDSEKPSLSVRDEIAGLRYALRLADR
jgi:hypothetical protein